MHTNIMKVVDLMFQSQHNAYHAFHDTNSGSFNLLTVHGVYVYKIKKY